jgi:hypothetical protein
MTADTNAWLTLDFVAKRYGKLPSEVLSQGSSLDVQCGELAVAFENYLNEKHRAEAEGKPMPVKYKQEELQAMMDAVKRGRANANSANTK